MDKKETMIGRIGRILFLIMALGGLSWAGISFYRDTFVKLPPPEQPPLFGVYYVYSFFAANPFEGLNFYNEITSDIKNIKTAGFGAVKINFHFQQNNSLSEYAAAQAAKNGMYPIGELAGNDQKPPQRAFDEKELAEWEVFVRDEVRANKDIIYYWEVWNEPAMTALRSRYGTPQEYLELLKRTQKIIKEENPAAKIIVTADYTDAQAETFTNEFLSLGGAQYLDYLSFHPYNALDPNSRYNLTETVVQEEELSLKYNKPLWITEIGYPDSDSNEANQAELAATLFKTAHENKIPIVWLEWSDRRLPFIDNKTGWGLVRKDNTAKPALGAIEKIINQQQ